MTIAPKSRRRVKVSSCRYGSAIMLCDEWYILTSHKEGDNLLCVKLEDGHIQYVQPNELVLPGEATVEIT